MVYTYTGTSGQIRKSEHWCKTAGVAIQGEDQRFQVTSEKIFFGRPKFDSVPESRLSMAKRGLQDVDEGMDTKAHFGPRWTKEDEDVQMGEFEDPWEDELRRTYIPLVGAILFIESFLNS